jgi:dTDP-glucose 4,6-dehydratase
VVSNFLTQAIEGRPLTVYGDGSQTRSLCFVDDEVAGILALLDSEVTGPVNIGNPDERSVLHIARDVIAAIGSRSVITFVNRPVDDPAVRRPDITFARELLEWEPVVAWTQGLARTITWFRASAITQIRSGAQQKEPPTAQYPCDHLSVESIRRGAIS